MQLMFQNVKNLHIFGGYLETQSDHQEKANTVTDGNRLLVEVINNGNLLRTCMSQSLKWGTRTKLLVSRGNIFEVSKLKLCYVIF